MREADLNRRAAACFSTWLLLFVASGASCPNRQQPLVPQAPLAFTTPPTLQDVMRTVNANTQRIQRLQTDTATLAIQGLPALRSNLAIQRPRSFRLRSQFMGLGQVLDLGSNDERFWAWIDAPQLATNVPRGVYYARHEQFLQSQARSLLPVQPDWLIEAFGLVEFDPAGTHEGPYSHGSGRFEIRSRIPSADGPVMRLTVLDERYGWLLEQHFYNPQGQLLASSAASNHRYYPEVGISLPHHVAVQLPPPNNSFQIDVQNYTINQLYSDAAQLFTMPTPNGYPLVDLGASASPPPAAAAPQMPTALPYPPGYPSPGASPYPTMSPASPYPPSGQTLPTNAPPPGYPTADFRPRYRGYTTTR